MAEEGAAKEGVQAAKGSTREKLQQALRKLSMVQAQLEAAKGDQQDYPLSPGFFSNGIFFRTICMINLVKVDVTRIYHVCSWLIISSTGEPRTRKQNTPRYKYQIVPGTRRGGSFGK